MDPGAFIIPHLFWPHLLVYNISIRKCLRDALKKNFVLLHHYSKWFTCQSLVVLSIDVDANSAPPSLKHTQVTEDEWPFNDRISSTAHWWKLALLFHRVNCHIFTTWSLPHVNTQYSLPLSVSLNTIHHHALSYLFPDGLILIDLDVMLNNYVKSQIITV
jgi:hypothetical protein